MAPARWSANSPARTMTFAYFTTGSVFGNGMNQREFVQNAANAWRLCA